MSLFSWFTSNRNEVHTTFTSSERQRKLAINNKSMWPVARVNYVHSKYQAYSLSEGELIDSEPSIKSVK